MRPDKETNEAFIYCLAVAAKRYEVKVIFTCAMSNHHHTGIVDRNGVLPEFLAYFHRLFANHQNALRQRDEAFWSSEQTSVVELLDAGDVLRALVYAVTNPVKDNLVERTGQWPGVNSLAPMVAEHGLTARRPQRFFSAHGDMPEVIVLDFHMPPMVDSGHRAEFIAEIQSRVADVELEAAIRRKDEGLTVMGPGRVLRQAWDAKPRTPEAKRIFKAQLMVKNLWRRIESLGRNADWLYRYREARERLLRGVEAVFPAGTYWLRRFVGVNCEPLDAT